MAASEKGLFGNRTWNSTRTTSDINHGATVPQISLENFKI
jgi:hypothetical protein